MPGQSYICYLLSTPYITQFHSIFKSPQLSPLRQIFGVLLPNMLPSMIIFLQIRLNFFLQNQTLETIHFNPLSTNKNLKTHHFNMQIFLMLSPKVSCFFPICKFKSDPLSTSTTWIHIMKVMRCEHDGACACVHQGIW